MKFADLSLDASVGLDPFQVAGHTGEGSGVALLATGSGSKGGKTDLDLAGSQDKGATGVTVAGGLAVGGGNTDVAGGHNRRAVGGGAHSVGDDVQINVLEVGGDGADGVAGASPSGGNSGFTGIGRVRAGDAGQSGGLDPG